LENLSAKIVAVVTDVMFAVKIQDAAKRAGLTLAFAISSDEALRYAGAHPSLIILDLNDASVDSLTLIERLRGDPATANVRLLGFVSHVQTEIRQSALQKGCDTVLPRSAFSQNLPSLLARYAENAP
jgi:CheY-like chemotaxis protein